MWLSVEDKYSSLLSKRDEKWLLLVGTKQKPNN